MRTIFFLLVVGVIASAGKLSAETPNSEFFQPVIEVWDLFWDDPNTTEQSEILKRIEEKNWDEIRSLRTKIKNILRTNRVESGSSLTKPELRQKLKEELEAFPNLGGVLLTENDTTVYQMGDFSDFFEDGFSREKFRQEGQIPSFPFGDLVCTVFIRNEPGSYSVDPNFIGFDTLFYAYGDEGTLRYTNDPTLDTSIRLGDFRKTFDALKKNIPEVSINQVNDLTVFLVPGKPRPLYWILTSLRLLLIVWGLILVFSILKLGQPQAKKSIA